MRQIQYQSKLARPQDFLRHNLDFDKEYGYYDSKVNIPTTKNN